MPRFRGWDVRGLELRVQGRKLVRVGKELDLPLIGSIAFGLIDRGTNVIQVRPVSYCVLNCVMCSTDAGPCSRWRISEYLVDVDLILEWFSAIARFKGCRGLEAHIDTVGDPLLYPHIEDLIQGLKEHGAEVVSLQTHGPTLTLEKAEKLAAAGLDRINLSLDSTDPDLARIIQGTEWFRVEKVMEAAEYIVANTPVDVHVAPVLIPGINDQEIPKIIEWGLRVGVGKKYPPFGIQKYLRHKRGRRPRGVREQSWSEFFRFLDVLSEKYKVNLRPSMEDFGMRRVRMLPQRYRVGEKVRLRVVAEGWMRSEKIGVPVGREDVVVTLVEADHVSIGSLVSAIIISNKHNIYLARARA